MYNRGELGRAFLKGFLAFITTFGLVILFGYLIHKIYPSYSLDGIVFLGIGCGSGNGLIFFMRNLRNG